MATVSVGTTSRNYLTYSSAEADADNGAVHSAGNPVVLEGYDDSPFDEDVIINGGGTLGVSSVEVTVASGERHDGTAGTGARNLVASTARYVSLGDINKFYAVRWLEFDGNQVSSSFTSQILSGVFSSPVPEVAGCILHGLRRSAGGNVAAINGNAGTRDISAINNFVYDAEHTSGGSDAHGIWADANHAESKIANNTVHDVVQGGSGASCGIKIVATSDSYVRNNISTDSNTGSGTDFDPASPGAGTWDYNLSSDTSASGTGSLTSKSAADLFVSTVSGSEDLHLKSGADAIGAGVDLGTTPSGVQFDIDGYDRDTNAVTWDIGADQFVSGGGGPTFSPRLTMLGVG